MKNKIHMQDQVNNRVEMIMDAYNSCSHEMWTLKAMGMMVVFLLLGINW